MGRAERKGWRSMVGKRKACVEVASTAAATMAVGLMLEDVGASSAVRL